jgi:hypothetical protein
MNSKELQSIIDKIEEKLINPKTAQGEINGLQFDLSNLKHKKRIAEREEYELKNNMSVYGSDDYAQFYEPTDLGFVKIIIQDGKIEKLERFLI